MRYRDFLFASLMAILLAACASSAPSDGFLPTVDDPDLEINVTPQVDQDYAYFAIVVTRIGEQVAATGHKIGWNASGEIYLKVTLDSAGPLNVIGTGFGKAGFDASSQVCIDEGGWPVEYTAEGHFDEDKCELTLKIEETWPKTEAHAACMGYSGSGGGGIYTLSFPSLNFKEDDLREDTTTTIEEGMMTWLNTFLLYPRDGLEDTDCVFDAPTPAPTP